MWPDRRLTDLFGTELPIVQAPMAGANGSAMASAVSAAGALGSLPCAMLDTGKARSEIGVIRQRTTRPLNVNFFCHTPPTPDPERARAWKERLAEYYVELGLDPGDSTPSVNRAPFDEAMCEVVEEHKPDVVSFHFWSARGVSFPTSEGKRVSGHQLRYHGGRSRLARRPRL